MSAADPWNMPITAFRDGQPLPVFPRQTIAAIADGPVQSLVWHITADALIERVQVNAELAHVRVALGLDDED